MRNRNVIALGKIVDHNFPVGGNIEVELQCSAEAIEVREMVTKGLRQSGVICRKIGCRIIQPGKQQSATVSQCDGFQRKLRSVKILQPIGMRCLNQFSVEAVAPGVVGADDAFPARAAAAEQFVSAVLTDIEKCVEYGVLITYQENALIGYALHTIVARVRYLAGMTDI